MYVSDFSPVLGGLYRNGGLYTVATLGVWWGSTAYGSGTRHYLHSNGSSLYTGYYVRYDGYYIRCVQAS